MENDKLNQLKLYIDSNHTSPYAMFAYIVLREKGISFETTQINVREKHHLVPTYQKLSLTGKVPILVHGDFALAESSAIIEYLEEAFPAPDYPRVLPQAMHQRARARQLQAWIRSDLLALKADRPSTVIFDQPVSSPLSEAGRVDAEKLVRVAESLIRDEGSTLFDAWSIVDTELALTLNRLVANGDTVPEKVKRYVKKQWERPSVQEWLKGVEADRVARLKG